jgi:hypothetical protein
MECLGNRDKFCPYEQALKLIFKRMVARKTEFNKLTLVKNNPFAKKRDFTTFYPHTRQKGSYRMPRYSAIYVNLSSVSFSMISN